MYHVMTTNGTKPKNAANSVIKDLFGALNIKDVYVARKVLYLIPKLTIVYVLKIAPISHIKETV